jgi:hypothetical protein
MLTAQVNGVGLINPTDYWSTARSGGRDGLGSPIAHTQGLGGPVDWHIEAIADAIENFRRQGKTDAQITKMLLAGEGNTGIVGGVDHQMVNMAFTYLKTGQLPPGVACQCSEEPYKFLEECCPQPPKTISPWLWVAGTVAAIGLVGGVVWAVRRS